MGEYKFDDGIYYAGRRTSIEPTEEPFRIIMRFGIDMFRAGPEGGMAKPILHTWIYWPMIYHGDYGLNFHPIRKAQAIQFLEKWKIKFPDKSQYEKLMVELYAVKVEILNLENELSPIFKEIQIFENEMNKLDLFMKDENNSVKDIKEAEIKKRELNESQDKFFRSSKFGILQRNVENAKQKQKSIRREIENLHLAVVNL